MNRREFLGAASAATVLGSLTASAARARTAERPPNIVMLISDDQGWGDYGFMGHPTIRTPHIDRLAAESLVFTRGYVTAPLCCPSLASMITGLHPHQHKITCNDPPRPGGDPKWTDERLAMRFAMHDYIEQSPTLPRFLAEKGYRSLQTGKWWMGHHRRGGFTDGMTHGDPAKGGRHGDAGLAIGRTTMQPLWDFIDEAADEPFFIWYAPMLPHLPHNPPERLFDYYKDKTPSEFVARYWAMCEWWDEGCGQLLDYLDEKGLAENTLVLYICDNGWIQREDSQLMKPRSKATRYEGGVRTPIMARWPGKVKPRRDGTHLASSVDLAPTILAACGLEPTDDMQGIDLLDRRAVRKRNAVFGAEYGHDAVDVHDPLKNLRYLWVVEGHWKLILPSRSLGGEGKTELYNVMEDPTETKDHADANPRTVKRMTRNIQAWWPEGAAALAVE